jgi:hypothetical protein
MTKCEKIMLSQTVARHGWCRNVSEWLHNKRAEDRQYTCDEAPYYVEVRHPKYRESRPYMYCPVVYYAWSLARAKRMAYEQARKGMKATIYDNETDEIVN